MPIFDVKIMSSLEALMDEGASYDAFLDRVRDDWSYYYRTPFLKTYLDLSQRKEQLSFFLVVQGGELVAVAPFVKVMQKWSHFWIKRLSFIGTGIKDLANEYPAILIDPEVDETAVLEALVAFFGSRHADWDQLDLSGLSDSGQFRFFRRWMKGSKSIELDPGFQTVFTDSLAEVIDRDLPKSRLREVKRLSRKTFRDHPSAAYHVDYGLTEELFDEIFSLHSARQQEKRDRGAISSQSFFDDPERRRRMKAKLICLAETGDLRVYRLTIEDRLIAFNLTLRSGSTEYGLFMAFDQSFGNFSPSKVLMLHILHLLDEEGVVTTLDHLSGPSMMKKDFCNVEFARFRLVAHNHGRLISFAKHNCYLATRNTYKFGAARLRAAKKILRPKDTKSAKAA